ncbi:MAG: hypothetical protein N2450_08820 [bacterium]|nr:hypothetical protein [bacterium]
MIRIIFLVTLFLKTALAQVLPNLENQIEQNDFASSPKLYVWERQDETNVHATLIIRLSKEDYLLYGTRLTKIIQELWNSSVPLRSLTDIAGKNSIQIYDSVLTILLKNNHTNEYQRNSILKEYFSQQSVLKQRVLSVNANLMVGRKLSVKSAIECEQAILVRFIMDNSSVDKWMDFIFEKVHQPFWLEAYEWFKRIEQGYPIESSARILMPLPTNLSLNEFWYQFIRNADVSVAIVGNVKGNEVITLSNLYWSNWMKKNKLSHADWNQVYTQFGPYTRPIPTNSQYEIKNWLASYLNLPYQEKCKLIISNVPMIHFQFNSLPQPPNPTEVYKRWLNWMNVSLNRADRAADLLAIAAINGGWEKWYEMDVSFIDYENIPDFYWLKKMLEDTNHVR